VQIKIPNFRAWPYCGATRTFFKLGLIAMQIELLNFQAWPYYVRIKLIFRIPDKTWPYCDANQNSKFSCLALLRCKSKFKIFEIGLITLQIDFSSSALLWCESNLFLGYQIELALLQCKWKFGNCSALLRYILIIQSSRLGLIGCKSIFQIFEFGLNAMKIGLAWFPCTSVEA